MTELEFTMAKLDIAKLEKAFATLTGRVVALEESFAAMNQNLMATVKRDVSAGLVRRPPPEGVEHGSL